MFKRSYLKDDQVLMEVQVMSEKSLLISHLQCYIEKILTAIHRSYSSLSI
jgi:hypothetical protein